MKMRVYHITAIGIFLMNNLTGTFTVGYDKKNTLIPLVKSIFKSADN